MILRNNKINIDFVLFFLFYFIFVSDSFLFIVFTSLRFFVTLPSKLDVIILYSFFSIFLLFYIPLIIKRVKPSISFIILFLYFIILISLFFNPTILDLSFKILSDFTFQFVPYIIIGYAINNFGLVKKLLIPFAITTLILFFIQYYLFDFDIFLSTTYSQNFGYMLMFPTLVFTKSFFSSRKVGYFILLVLSFSFVIFLGARGPIFVSLSYFLFCLILTSFKKPTNLFLFLLIIFSLLTNLQPILSFLVDLSIELNLSTRVLDQFIRNDFFNDIARTGLFTYSLQLISNNLFFGLGIGYERILLSNFLTGSPAQAYGFYPHNFFIEVLLNFGVILGSIFIIWFINLIYISFRNKNNELSFFLFFVCFMPLLISGSYLAFPSFAFYLGYLLKLRKSYFHV